MLSFTDKGWRNYTEWEDEDRKTLKKIKRPVQSIERDGAMNGEDKPEKLKNKIDTYSRRIDDKNRLVYIANAGNFTITSCKGHYEEN